MSSVGKKKNRSLINDMKLKPCGPNFEIEVSV